MGRRLVRVIGVIAGLLLLSLGVTIREQGDTESVTAGGPPSPAVIGTGPSSTPTTTKPATSTTDLPVTSTSTSTSTSTTMPKTTTTTRPKPVTTTTRPAAPTTTTTTGGSAPAPLRNGASGPEVSLLQQRLSDLGYWPGAIDGRFGDNTFHAVVALQKAAGLPRNGVVDATTAAALDRGLRPDARSTAGRAVEIDLTRQILLLVQDGHVEHILDTSTGRPGLETPKGQFRIHHQLDTANYHGQYRPKQFYAPRDLAIHGYSSVPPSPYSHGCARVTLRAMDWLWANGRIPVGTPVLIY